MASGWIVPEDEVTFRFTASGGPGGQHANRSNTKVDAVFRPGESSSMPAALRERVVAALGPMVRVTVDDERSQLRNRQLALERIRARVEAAGVVPRTRRPTKRSRGSQRRRLDAKRKRGDVKRARRKPGYDE